MSRYDDGKGVRTFDYIPRLDERNLAYRATIHPLVVGQDAVDLMTQRRFWFGGAVLDQGAEGSCVGHGVVGEYLASPVRGKGNSAYGHEMAVKVYNRAKEIDEWEGVNYDGTSVRAGMLVGREQGWWESFYWATSIYMLRQALEIGPVVIGVTWTGGMYETDARGVVHVTGNAVGGHCLLITGYSPDYNGMGQLFRWRNSWGKGYGKMGNGYVSPRALQTVIFDEGNEAAVPVERHQGTS